MRQIGRPPAALYVNDRPTGEVPDAPSLAEREQKLREDGRSYVLVDDDRSASWPTTRDPSTFMSTGRPPPEITITDDPTTFAGTLPIDHDVARLVPLMKFVPPPLSIVRGAERLPPGALHVYDRRSLAPISQESFLPTFIVSRGERRPTDDVRETLGGDRGGPGAGAGIAGDLPQRRQRLRALVHLLKQGGFAADDLDRRVRHPDRPAGGQARGIGRSTLRRAVALGDDRQGDRTLEHLPTILDHMKEPFADVALVPEAVLGLAMRREMGC